MKKGKQKMSEKINSPLQTKKCIDLVSSYLNKNKVLLEVGSGYSTIDFASKTKKVCSIEHQDHWYNTIKDLIRKNKIKNVEYALVKPNMEVIREKSIKYNFEPSVGGGGGRYWDYDMYSEYIEQIGKFKTNFDVCFIDGQARQHCCLYAFNFLNENGIVIIHDFYNIPNLNSYPTLLDKHWNLEVLFKYYEEIESIKEVGKGRKTGNDLIVLIKKPIRYDIEDMRLLDKEIPRL